MNYGTLLVASLAALLMFTNTVAYPLGEWLALGLIIIAGIPHGSFDLRVAEAKWGGEGRSRLLILAAYVISGIAMSAVCVAAPTVGLALFLLISVFHFSGGEVVEGGRLRAAVIGLSAVLLPIGLHLSEAQGYLGYFVPESLLDIAAPALKGLSIVMVVVVGVILSRDTLRGEQGLDSDTIQRWICLLAWVLLPPLSGFAVWFLGRHSRHHLEVCRDFFRSSRRGIPIDFVVISLVAILLIVPLSFLFDVRDINQLFAASIVLIAGLTLPHMLVTHDIHGTLRRLGCLNR